MKNNGLVRLLANVLFIIGFFCLTSTFTQCRMNEKKSVLYSIGGTRMILELNVAEAIRSLSGNNKDANFNKALDAAYSHRLLSNRSIIDVFVEEYRRLEPGKQLFPFFCSHDLKDRINIKSSDKQVISVLKSELKSMLKRSMNVLQLRIDQFGVESPIVKLRDVEGRILVELPGIKEPERIRKLLQTSAKLDFWETYEYAQLQQAFIEADTVLARINIVNDVHPFMGPFIGIVRKQEMNIIDSLLNLQHVKKLLPSNVIFKWSVNAQNREEQFCNLYALKVTNSDGSSALSGDVVVEAKADFSQNMKRQFVSIRMNDEGAKAWEKLTRDNIGKSIAMVLDDLVFTAPHVPTEIPGGMSEISGVFTEEEAQDLAILLNSGQLAASFMLVDEEIISP